MKSFQPFHKTINHFGDDFITSIIATVMNQPFSLRVEIQTFPFLTLRNDIWIQLQEIWILNFPEFHWNENHSYSHIRIRWTFVLPYCFFFTLRDLRPRHRNFPNFLFASISHPRMSSKEEINLSERSSQRTTCIRNIGMVICMKKLWKYIVEWVDFRFTELQATVGH